MSQEIGYSGPYRLSKLRKSLREVLLLSDRNSLSRPIRKVSDTNHLSNSYLDLGRGKPLVVSCVSVSGPIA